jgi:DNA-binding NarL/FixJ family response regulator
MQKTKLMIVDDHPAFRDGLSRLLKEEPDLDVVATPEDGENAVKLAAKLSPDIIIMDISMAGMNGIEATKRIKANHPEIAVLVISAFSYRSYVLAALRAGAAGYLLKNTPLQDIIKAIRLIHAGEDVFDIKLTSDLFRKIQLEKTDKRPNLEDLHPRELEILSLVAGGSGNKDIASKLSLSERTVQTHLANIFRKLQVSSRTEAVLQGLRQGWLTLDDLPSS